ECLQEGPLDWSTQLGRLTDALLAEANHDYAQKISRNTIRGRVSKLEAKIYPHGLIPFGFDRVYEGSGRTIRVPPTEKCRMPRPRHGARDMAAARDPWVAPSRARGQAWDPPSPLFRHPRLALPRLPPPPNSPSLAPPPPHAPPLDLERRPPGLGGQELHWLPR